MIILSFNIYKINHLSKIKNWFLLFSLQQKKQLHWKISKTSLEIE